MERAMVKHKTMDVDGLSIFYREAGDPANPKLVLLGGFPASSHQFRNLIPALADRFHVLSPDYPGFGNSDLPDPAKFEYTFDRLSAVIEKLLMQTGFTKAGYYMHDYGGPIGLRFLVRHPDWVEWLVLQNSNAYEEGFTPAWDGLRNALWKDKNEKTEAALLPFLSLEGIKMMYHHGHKNPDVISPDNWQMDFRFMERPNARRAQLDLFYDYRKNVDLYPAWQAHLRERQPETLIFWGQNDIFFTPEGGEAYLRDLPSAELVRLDTGHFAVEDCLDDIAAGIRAFYERKIAPRRMAMSGTRM
jgi:pimeloyl-ACP methyl ester carboxylesterase